MASLQKIVLHEGEGITPNHGDKVACTFASLTAAGQPIPIHQADLEFSSAGNAITVLLAVVGLQNKLSKERMAILQLGFEFFISRLKFMKKGELAQILNEDIEGAKKSNSDFCLHVELKEVVRLPDGHAPVSADRRPLPEDNAHGAAPTYLDLRPF
ncbi:hypothetical protein CNMCM5878_004496 [Aspergillus fumigatiaffinis]|nr:hypothetical protein CNMCM5878_004496 [Aspergillus fumigatiaffinis]